jgi:diaminopimelate epimerase
MQFSKYEGLGNDFILVESDTPLDDRVVRALCDRHFGIGADGVLVVGRGSGQSKRMIVQNADGSRPEMCGNGLRCVALHLALQTDASCLELEIDTDAGSRSALVDRTDGRATVTIGLGPASWVGTTSISVDGVAYTFDRISVGNPHAVRLGDIPGVAVVDRVGPALSGSVPGGTNVEFVAPRGPDSGEGFDLVVWERGVGRTLACGTGAGATAAALAFGGKAPFDAPIRMHLPGGPLELSVAKGTHEVTLRGPARWVFDGRTSL